MHNFSTALLLLALLTLSNCQPNASLRPVNERAQRPYRASVAAGDYLIKNLTQDGRFNYRRFASVPDSIPTNRYNLLRHAGSVYALGQLADLEPRPELTQTIVAGASFLRNRTISTFPPDQQNNLAVYSRSQIVGGNRGELAKLGGTALCILAFLAAERHQPGFTTVDEMTRLGNTILYFQQPSGHFHSTYLVKKNSFNTGFKSLFYPGEAILALIELYRVDPQDKWLDAAIRGLDAISTSRSTLSVAQIPSDHWALLATTALLEHAPASEYEGKYERYMNHAVQILQNMLSRQRLKENDNEYYGTFNRVGNTTPIGTKMEGMLAIAPHLEAYNPILAAQVRTAAITAMKQLYDAQLEDGPLVGGVTYLPAKIRRVKPEDKPKYTRIQIDNVQHVMSGWLWAVKRADWLYTKPNEE